MDHPSNSNHSNLLVVLSHYQKLWENFWRDQRDPFQFVVVQRDNKPISISIPEQMRVMHLDEDTNVLARTEYAEAEEAIHGR